MQTVFGAGGFHLILSNALKCVKSQNHPPLYAMNILIDRDGAGVGLGKPILFDM